MNAHPWHLAVVIPSHNEQELLPRCLLSIDRARRRLPRQVTSDVIVAVDSSSDQTYAIAQRTLGLHGSAIRLDAHCVGMARELAARTALARFSGDPASCWLANTDADCEVPETWLLQHLEYANLGWSAVAGIVDVDSFSEHPIHVERRFRETYLIHSDGTHPHVHGANLGIRADIYLDAGGWSGLCTAEDHHLWNRLRLRKANLLADARLSVLTSGRRIGRAPNGFADALAAHHQIPA